MRPICVAISPLGTFLKGMEALDILSILLTLAALFGYINLKTIKLPTTIGIMLFSVCFSILLFIIKPLLPGGLEDVKALLESIDFNKTLMEGMLSYLLFAGALHVNLGNLKEQKWVVAILASVGVVFSTFMIGGATYYILPLLGFEVKFLWCLLFGALISPTDPVAVLGILKQAGAPKSLETKITGESLFNDGVGVVIYLVLIGMLGSAGHDHGGDHHATEMTALSIAQLFALEAGGGILWGALIGAVGFYLLKSINNYQIEILISLALVTAGYQAAYAMHLSGPLAMVVAGLMLGNQGRSLAMSDSTREHLDTFWELVDEILNAVLFLLIGLELLVLDWNTKAVIFGLIAIPLTLIVRYVAASIPITILKRFQEFSPKVVTILTWGGLRGGISIALALGLPKDPEYLELRNVILVAAYMVVIFSIAVQGLTLKSLIQRCLAVK